MCYAQGSEWWEVGMRGVARISMLLPRALMLRRVLLNRSVALGIKCTYGLGLFLYAMFLAQPAQADFTLTERGELDVTRERYGDTSEVMAFEPTHNYLAELSVFTKNPIRLWDWQDKKVLVEYPWTDVDRKFPETGVGIPRTFSSKPLAFSKDGRYLAACRSANEGPELHYVRVWNAQSGQVVKDVPAFQPDGNRATCVALDFSPDSKTLAVIAKSGGRDKSGKNIPSYLVLLNTADWTIGKTYVIEPRRFPLEEISYDASGRHLATAYALYNRRPKEYAGVDVHDEPVVAIVWDLEREVVVASRVVYWALKGGTGRVHLSFGPGDRTVLANARGGGHPFEPEHCLGYYDPPDIPSGFTKEEFCAVDKEIQRWDWKADELRTLKAFPFVHIPNPRPNEPDLFEFVMQAVYSPTGAYIAVAKTEERKSEVRKNFDRVNQVLDFVIEIRDPDSFEKLSEYRTHRDPGRYRFQISADGRFIAFYSQRNIVKILEVTRK